MTERAVVPGRSAVPTEVAEEVAILRHGIDGKRCWKSSGMCRAASPTISIALVVARSTVSFARNSATVIDPTNDFAFSA